MQDAFHNSVYSPDRGLSVSSCSSTSSSVRKRDVGQSSAQKTRGNTAASVNRSPRGNGRSGGEAYSKRTQFQSFLYLLFGAFVGMLCRRCLRELSIRCPLDFLSSSDRHLNNVFRGAAGPAAVLTSIVSIKTPPRFYAFQPNVHIKASKKLFQSLPTRNARSFYADMSRINHGMVRALRDQGWTKVKNRNDARFIYTYRRVKTWYPKLKPWQRYNHIPNTAAWNQKDNFALGFREWEAKTGIHPYFVPLTFDFSVPEQKNQFRKLLYDQGGLNSPWVLKIPNVNQGKGITMLGPHTDELKDVFKTVENAHGRRYIIQQYICNEMTWQKRKFDVRIYWLVASLDPLVVLYIDGYVRIGNAEYSESDFSNTRSHLTTHTFLGEEGKASYAQLNQRLLDHVDENPHLKDRIRDPISHVRNQFKESIGMLVDAFKDKTFLTGPPLGSEDAFEFYGADFVIDNDLDLWMIEAQDDTGIDEDHDFRLDMHHQIFYGMGLVLSEIWDKQAKGSPILPLVNTGQWEVVYAGGWRFESPDGYTRAQDKKSCTVK